MRMLSGNETTAVKVPRLELIMKNVQGLKPMNRVVKESGHMPGLGNSVGHQLRTEAI